MEISYGWLSEYVDLDKTPEEVATRLTAGGLAVEGIERRRLSDGSEDTVFEVDITANRPDAMNHLGVAREAAALFGVELKPPPSEVERSAEDAASVVRLQIEDFDLCPRYTALVLRGVTIGPSPPWLVARLEAIGQRSINNVVDVTNFVLWETGQPLHAFDLAKLGGGDGSPVEIGVRRSREGERLVTLDEVERELDSDVLVITVFDRPVALAGIMGGADTEVGETTRDVLLESAHFDPATVRAGGRKVGLHTDARHRFERGADPEGCLWAAERAAALMVEAGGGEVLSGAADLYRRRAEWPPTVEVALDKLNRFSGVELEAREVESVLARLGFHVTGTESAWRVEVPSWRYYDFRKAYPADVYEEVLRIHGFDQIPSTLPPASRPDATERPEHRRRRQIQDVLAASGYVEAINFAFHDETSDTAYPTLFEESSEALRLMNPISERYGVLRRSLLPNLVSSARYNLRRGAASVRLFEVGHVFRRDPGQKSHEEEALALVAGGRLGSPWERSLELDFYDLKGTLEDLGAHLGVGLELLPRERPKLAAGTGAEIRRAGEEEAVGYMGRLDEEDLPFPVFVAEIRMSALAADGADLRTRPPSRFPSIAVDSTLTHPLGVSYRDIAAAIRDSGTQDLVEFGLKDRYGGPGIPEGSVATTLYFLYNSEERSLTQEEVNERHLRLAAELERRFGDAGAPS